MKSASTYVSMSDMPAEAARSVARRTPSPLMFTPVMCTFAKRASSMDGPPMPLPNSMPRMPGLSCIISAKKCSCRSSAASMLS